MIIIVVQSPTEQIVRKSVKILPTVAAMFFESSRIGYFVKISFPESDQSNVKQFPLLFLTHALQDGNRHAELHVLIEQCKRLPKHFIYTAILCKQDVVSHTNYKDA